MVRKTNEETSIDPKRRWKIVNCIGPRKTVIRREQRVAYIHIVGERIGVLFVVGLR